jgi:hypothetical protein
MNVLISKQNTKMKSLKILAILMAFSILFLASCSDDEETDTLKPEINMEGADAFPKPCDTIYRGGTFTFKAEFSDNVELGAYNLELHHNFDHHTHGNHVETCPVHPDKEPVNPFYFNQNYDIPAGSSTYLAEVSIDIPADVDTGDYHFMVKVTDQEGWSAWQSVSVKIED